VRLRALDDVPIHWLLLALAQKTAQSALIVLGWPMQHFSSPLSWPPRACWA
jgi:hypothetical protein